MSEDRIAALEMSVSLVRADTNEALQDIRTRLAAQQRSLEVLTNVGTKQQLTNMELAENMTMLLGITTTHQREGKGMQAQLASLESRLASVERGIATMDTKITILDSRLERVEQGIATIIAMLNKGMP
ncbi:MAG: hypothetical protein JO202_01950 [Ktedonobacteraceae bacterium]|nr:hypothetical protein [Ktedonobacteraceae bacterium]